MSANVPLKETFDALVLEVAALAKKVDSLPEPVELTDKEKAAIQTVFALINRLIGGA